MKDPTGHAKKNILVTGAAGFIAFHLIEALLRRGHSVAGIDNFDPFYDKPIKLKNLEDLRRISQEVGSPFDFYEQDVIDLREDFLLQRKLDCVIHLAAKAGVRPSIEAPDAYVRANINGTLQLLECCRRRGISEILFGSSSSVYGNDTPAPFREDYPCSRPISPYAATKRAGELLCYNYSYLYGMKIASLRFFTVYGPRQRPDLAIHKFARLIHEGKPIPLFGDGNTSRDYTFVTDIISGILNAYEWLSRSEPGTFEIFNLGGSATTTLNQLVSMIEKTIGKTATVHWTGRQPGDVERTFADLTKSRKVLGYHPQIAIEEGISKFVEWFLEQVRVTRRIV